MVVIDVTELLNNPIRAGIQRVVRELIRHWPSDVPMLVARHDKTEGLVAVPDAAIEQITDRSPEVVGQSVAEVALHIAHLMELWAPPLPEVDRILIPEVFFDADRCRFYRARLSANATSVAFIVYDFIPWLHPDRIGVRQSASLMPYLRLLRSSGRLAFISSKTKHDYTERVMRGRSPANGPVLSLGSDGLGLRDQAFAAGRRGFLCIGSIDGRKNQDQILRAFQILWAQGHQIPLTIVGDCFPQIDASAFESARAHPLFCWYRHADDKTLRYLLSGIRGTIYVSDLEGYGIPPVESLYAGIPVICSASVPSLADLSSAGQVRLERVNPAAIAEAVLTLSDNAICARLWDEARNLHLATWDTFARQVADWMECA